MAVLPINYLPCLIFGYLFNALAEILPFNVDDMAVQARNFNLELPRHGTAPSFTQTWVSFREESFLFP